MTQQAVKAPRAAKKTATAAPAPTSDGATDPPPDDDSITPDPPGTPEPARPAPPPPVALPSNTILVGIGISLFVVLLVMIIPIISLNEKSLVDVKTRTDDVVRDAVTVVMLFMGVIAFLAGIGLAVLEFVGRATYESKAQAQIDGLLTGARTLGGGGEELPALAIANADTAKAVEAIAKAGPELVKEWGRLPHVLGLLLAALLLVGGAAGMAVSG